MNKQEYEEKFFKNQRLSGFGLDVTMHMPCTVCAEPDFIEYKILEVEEVLTKPHVCRHCGFGMKAIFTHDNSGVSMQFAQTDGEDLPDYLPRMRRHHE